MTHGNPREHIRSCHILAQARFAPHWIPPGGFPEDRGSPDEDAEADELGNFAGDVEDFVPHRCLFYEPSRIHGP